MVERGVRLQEQVHTGRAGCRTGRRAADEAVELWGSGPVRAAHAR